MALSDKIRVFAVLSSLRHHASQNIRPRLQVHGHRWRCRQIWFESCRRDASEQSSIEDQQSMRPTLSLCLQLISKDDDTNTNEPPSVRTRTGIQNISSCQHCLSFDSACLGVGSGSFGGLGQSHSAALTRRSPGSGS